MIRHFATLALALVPALAIQAPDKAIDLQAARPAAAASFESLWASYLRADRAGSAEEARRIFDEIRRLRIERNIESLDVVALALVAEGLDRLGRGERERAEEMFQGAVGLDPHLPDAHFALAQTELRKGPLGLLPAGRHVVSGVLARLASTRGRYHALLLLVPVGLLVLFATLAVLAGALMVRHGTLLLHDLQESLGTGRGGTVALALFVFLLLVPPITFQGWGWLPLWWLALLFAYMSGVERAISIVLLLGTLAVGPVVAMLEARTEAVHNPLFWAGVQAREGQADPASIARLETAVKQHADDRDLVYLLAAQYKKAGRYDDAGALYRDVLAADPGDRIARNNLAGLDFARGDYSAALARYRQATESGPAEVMATLYYNQSQAHLQMFEYQPAQEARSQADRLAPRLIAGFDRRWRYDKGDYAAVDLRLSADQLWAKFAGAHEGVGVKNVARLGQADAVEANHLLSASLNRFAGFAAVFAGIVLGVSVWRGRRMFTMHCLKCGTPFCRRCHLGPAGAGLCSQCHHLFVVRDGVSGPARNRKLLEVQAEEGRRARVFRLLSLLSPGTGHLYAHRPVLGLAFVVVWYLTIVTVLLGGRALPVTEAPGRYAWPWGIALALVVLAVTWIAANRLRPDFDGGFSVLRAGAPRRARAS